MSWDAVLIAGPTASGKSGAALDLAAEIGGAVINADSMQVYGELRVLTARPSEDDESKVPHRLYGHVPVTERYSVGRYAEDAGGVLEELRVKGLVPIFAGGTGLYFNALLQGLAPIPPVPEGVRSRLEARLDEIGLPAFFTEFSARDPETAARLRPSDRQRILRAASVFDATGEPLVHWHKRETKPPLGQMTLARFVLAPPRAELYARIGVRFDAMLAAGALDEARRLLSLDPSLPAARALGLPELRAFVEGKMPLEKARDEAVTHTRNYAKRQLSWFRRFMMDWKWLESDNLRNIIAVMSHKNA